MADAIVVGAGPNGLAAALVLAGAGLRVTVYEAAPTIGGGTRTAELTLPGFHHDVCSAVHPMGVASPFFRAFDLAAHGVDMRTPEVSFAHPLDAGVAGAVWPDVDRTAAQLGVDGPAWRSVFEPLVARWDEVATVAMSDFRSLPAPVVTAARLGLRVLEFGSPLWSARLRGEPARALLAGVAAHALTHPRAVVPAGVGLLLTTLAQGVGWPIPIGGSHTITEAMAAELIRAGGEIVTDHEVESLSELPPSKVVLLDVTPTAFARMADLPRYGRRYRYGPGVCKVDFALSGPVPWTAEECGSAGTVHVVGSRADIVRAERAVAAGKHAERPYVLAAQPGVVDPTRAPATMYTMDTYAHVPHGSPCDISDAVIGQIERFAPGFRDLIVAQHVIPAAEMPRHNANYVGGDIAAGALSAWQAIGRPTPRPDPYRTPVDGVYLCSSATPPGPGVHGMCGVHAAARALRHEFGIRTDPLTFVRPRPATTAPVVPSRSSGSGPQDRPKRSP